MNTKLLVGSIVSVVILILVSFTSVFGYRSISSDVKVSPLFNIRSSKVIGKESKDIACDYVGKGEESILSIPKRDNRKALVLKFIDIINRMDDKKFNIFKASVINQINRFNNIKGFNVNNLVEIINKLKINQKGLLNNVIDRKGDEQFWTKDTCLITCGCPELTVDTKYLCYILLLLFIPLYIILDIMFNIIDKIWLINQLIKTILTLC
ncbi:MAG: hypothetical protein JSW06_07300 [Thermoplasmatales archaeon]|nr:MAG: hypothetical protein JSW06_07300 [Thermoplasmatales archaeon]